MYLPSLPQAYTEYVIPWFILIPPSQWMDWSVTVLATRMNIILHVLL